MIKALKGTMIAFGVVGIIAGLMNIFLQDQMAKTYGFGQLADYVRWIMALGGASYLAAGIWVIVVSRDPIRHIHWVKFLITKSWLFMVVTAYTIIMGYVSFSQVGVLFVLFIIFAILFLVFYPWRRKESSGATI
ncbi:MAG: hypothetical protein WB564_03825 [Dehalococcoidia bacterium]